MADTSETAAEVLAEMKKGIDDSIKAATYDGGYSDACRYWAYRLERALSAQGEAVAWMHPDGRVISAGQKAEMVADTESHFSAIASRFSIPLVRASTHPAPARVTEGWVLVPRDPTPEMCKAIRMCDGIHGRDSYREMLAAAPQPAVEAVPRSALATLADLRVCFASWQPDVCVLGNVRAADAVKALDSVLRPEPAPSAPEDVDAVAGYCRSALQAFERMAETAAVVEGVNVAVMVEAGRRLSGAQHGNHSENPKSSFSEGAQQAGDGKDGSS